MKQEEIIDEAMGFAIAIHEAFSEEELKDTLEEYKKFIERITS